MRIHLRVTFCLSFLWLFSAGCDGKLYTMRFAPSLDLKAAKATILRETDGVARDLGFRPLSDDELSDLEQRPLAAYGRSAHAQSEAGWIRVLVIEAEPGKLGISLLC